uniref:DUF834 domain-containing protein n=1 Tax=Oryza brachyantha TaxID=4533 RepID=J3ML89_ORYBR
MAKVIATLILEDGDGSDGFREERRGRPVESGGVLALAATKLIKMVLTAPREGSEWTALFSLGRRQRERKDWRGRAETVERGGNRVDDDELASSWFGLRRCWTHFERRRVATEQLRVRCLGKASTATRIRRRKRSERLCAQEENREDRWLGGWMNG